MATKSPLENDQPTSETVTQNSLLQQAQAAAAAQINHERDARQEPPLQTADLITPDAAEGDVAPPAYGEIYGEIRSDRKGMDTSARVTEDGRVNIRINQLNRRFSQVFVPALRQQIRTVEDSSLPPAPYIPPTLGGSEEIAPPPPLNIVIQVVGSRGDVQPFVALGKILKDTYGHRVRLATHPTFKNFVQENGLEFFSIGGDPSQLMAFMVKNPRLMPGFRSLLDGDVGQQRRTVAEYIQGCWRSCYKSGDGMDVGGTVDDRVEPGSVAKPFVADCIIANPPSFAHVHCAEKLGIPLHIMFTMPYSPTQAFPHPLANIQSSNADPQLTNYISYTMVELLSWQGDGDIINRFRAKCLGLDPVSMIWAPGMLQRLKIPHTYCWSPTLIPKPKDWGPHISIAGFYLLNLASSYSPAPDLHAFLDAGPPPVYIGFGSIVLNDPDAMTELIFETVRKTGQRVLLSKGWGGMGTERLQVPEGIFMLDNVPHDWLFKHVSCVVHHGGAGTTAAGIITGRPTVVVPFFGDQPFWGAMVARAGAGPDPIPQKQLTADKLADAINFCLTPKCTERAKELASKIAEERGSDMGAQVFHQYLEVDRLRCILAPSRPATWRIKRTQVRLSAFAACTLANAKLLDFRNLELFRAQEYQTDEGPWDPLSGGAAACYRAFSGMAMGVAEFPTETLKPWRTPMKASRKQSQESVSTTAKNNEPSHVEQRSTSSTPPQQSQTSLDVPEPFTHVRSNAKLSRTSSTASTVASSSMSATTQGQSNPSQDKASQGRVLSRGESGSSKDHDMLRYTGVHTSKGLGRLVKAAVKAPMEVSVGLTKGFHNVPKLWGDDTVRPQEQVTDFKSGAVAAGKEFGFGLYDGVTGLVVQPWKGAQREGATGFLKGFGKGLGGFVAKPSAGLSGVLGYTMKGVHKEMQKWFGSNVQNYIVASRVAQGYEEWLQSSDTEKQDVIVRWKLIQKYVKKDGNSDGMIQEILEAHQRKDIEDTSVRQSHERTGVSAQSAVVDGTILDYEGGINTLDDSQSSRISLRTVETDENIRLSFQRTSSTDSEADANIERAIHDSESQFQRQQQAAVNQLVDQDDLRQAISASETEAQQHASEESQYEEQLKQAMAHSLDEERLRGVDGGELVSNTSVRSDKNNDIDRKTRGSAKETRKAALTADESKNAERPRPYDSGYLAGIRQSEFEAHQQREKTTEEKTEEEIVMEYVKKQSLLEAHHRDKGKGRATTRENENDEDS